jgi:23S rRNA (uracil1939-C5)-methyltransferase
MELDLEITGLSRAGAGLGRDASGRVIFVPFTAPGDLVRVKIVSEEKRYADGELLEILRPSPDRATPPCPVFGKCGGCEWQHLPYSLQWDTKKHGVAHALSRVQVETSHLVLGEFPADVIWEYRNRIQLRGYKEKVGFYARGSKNLVPISKCYIARPELNAWIEDVREEGMRRVREYKAELEVFPDGVTTLSWNQGHSAQGFRQVHDEQNAKLQKWVADNLSPGPILLDLYGGRGNLSLGIKERFGEIHCVDFSAREEESHETMQFHRAAVKPWLEIAKPHLASFPSIDVILDPPREGLGPDLAAIVDLLKNLPVRKILLVGCDVDSWARALARFVRHGWKLDSYAALDFFPQTHHVEALGILWRTEGVNGPLDRAH